MVAQAVPESPVLRVRMRLRQVPLVVPARPAVTVAQAVPAVPAAQRVLQVVSLE